MVPLYIHFLGVEAFGLVGFYTSLTAVFFLLDFGFSATLQQELAKSNKDVISPNDRINLIRTLELTYLILAGLGIVLILLSKDFLTQNMILDSKLGAETILNCVVAIAFLLASRMLIGLYIGALNGLQQQFKLNLILIILEVIKFISIVLCLVFFWNHILAYFLINIIIGVATILLLNRIVWKQENPDRLKAHFQFQVIKNKLKFTLGVSLISIISVILTQADKFLLTRLVNLEEFGYYTLAFSIAAIPMKFVSSVSAAIYPRMVFDYSLGNEESLSKTYQKSCQLISFVIVPVCLALFFYTNPILSLWFKNELVVNKIEWLVKIFVLGFMLNGIMTMPYYLQLVYRWTSLSIIKNLVALIIFIPLLIYLVRNFGVIGASCIWLVLNGLYVIIEIPVMHSVLLPRIQFKWYLNCVAIPILVAGAFYYLGQFAIRSDVSFGIVEWILISLLILVSMFSINKLMSEQPLSFLNKLLRA